MPPLRAADLPPRSGWFDFGYTSKCEKIQKAVLAGRSEAEAAQMWALVGVEETEWWRLNTILNNESWSRYKGWFLPEDELFQIIFDSDDLFLFICEVEDQFQRTLSTDDYPVPWRPTLTLGEFYEIIRESPPGPPERTFHKGCCALLLCALIAPAILAAVWSLCKGTTIPAACEFTALVFLCTISSLMLFGIVASYIPHS
ncbi:MAG: hypothetical protein IJU53_09250 [Thermoguttaceae bacterium]|nr:hypothetical protein [Thermoguttaceae bacterium]